MNNDRFFPRYFGVALVMMGAALLVAVPSLVAGVLERCETGLDFAPALTEPAPESPPNSTPGTKVEELYGRLPLYFIENRGQADRTVKFYAHSGGQTTWFTKDGVGVTLARQLDNPSQTKRPGLAGRQQNPAIKTTTVALRPVGLKKRVKIAAIEPQEHRVNYFIGDDPKKWRTDIPTYRAVVYREAYQGIDLKFYGDGRQLEYDIIVKPGADPKRVKFQYAGIKGLEVTPAGDLAIKLPDGGVLVQRKPVVYQEIAGSRMAREGKFKLHGNLADYTYGFEVASYDQAHPLVIDPVMVYSTYLGGSASDWGNAIAVDQTGQIYVTGSTSSANFPHPNAYQPSRNGLGDAFVTKINAAGTALIYSTYLGGSGDFDVGNGIAVAAGEAYVVGTTDSPDFPKLDPVQPSYGGGFNDAFVAKLTANGSALIFSTCLGGSGIDYGNAIALNDEGTAFVTGGTDSTNFPTLTPLQPQKGGATDAFVAKIEASGRSLEYSTYLGGGAADAGNGIAVDQIGCIYVTGNTLSMNFPTKDPFQSVLNRGNGAGYTDAFVSKINATGSALVFSTYLGGGLDDRGRAIAVDQAGAVYVTGGTDSIGDFDFPTQNPLPGSAAATRAAESFESSSRPYTYDAFVTKLRPDGQALVYSTLLGGSLNLDEGYGIAVDQQGQAHVTGLTWASNFPTKDSLQPFGGFQEGFVTKLSAPGSSLVYSTFLAGRYGTTHGHGIAVDLKGNAYVTGHTDVTLFPVKNPLQPNIAGGDDAFVMKIYDPPKGAVGTLLLLLLN